MLCAKHGSHQSMGFSKRNPFSVFTKIGSILNLLVWQTVRCLAYSDSKIRRIVFQPEIWGGMQFGVLGWILWRKVCWVQLIISGRNLVASGMGQLLMHLRCEEKVWCHTQYMLSQRLMFSMLVWILQDNVEVNESSIETVRQSRLKVFDQSSSVLSLYAGYKGLKAGL